MGIIEKLFKKKNNNNNKEIDKIIELSQYLDNLLSNTSYIARSDYIDNIKDYTNIVQYYNVLINSHTLNNYCKKNKINNNIIIKTIENYQNIDDLVKKHNENYVLKQLETEKEYLDQILKEVDPNILLDEDQRRVVLEDEDHTLVVAGAGAGKTTTVAAKVKYLVEKKEIKPEDILVLSFTNKAVKELKEKLNRDLNIPCLVTTFHSIGYSILRKEMNDKLNIYDGSKMFYVLQDYFKVKMLKNEKIVNDLILFFASYFDAPYEGNDLNYFFNTVAKNDYSTMKSELNEFKREIIDRRSKKKITINNEYVRSLQEVEIANFLYMNQLDYDYEPIYPYDIDNTSKPYTPDFIVKQGDNYAYIEHFGISQDGKNNLYNEEELERYKKAVKDKIKLHKQHGTKLVFTFSSYTDNRSILEHLEKELIRNGFILNKRSNEEIMNKIISSEENKYTKKLIDLICRFISNFKANGYTEDEFEIMYYKTTNVRTRLFLNICRECYLEYKQFLIKNNAVDFEDMINESSRILRELKDSKQIINYKYIIVDEYQDISRQRFNLVSAIKDVCKAKIIAVGDDWQSIYAFSGSDITLFTKFEESVGYANQLKIVRTYRNSQEVIDIAGKFIQKNSAQITKRLISPKHIDHPVIIYTYDSTRKKRNENNISGATYRLACSVEKALDQIVKFDPHKNHNILLLGRFGFDGIKLENTGLFEFSKNKSKIKSLKYPHLHITFMTAHASKGLGYDNVIIINGKNDTYGFPSKIEDDPVLSFVVKNDRSIDYAEERRLFYVAMTRTKNRVYIIAPINNPSEFLLEIKHDYENVTLQGNWNENVLVSHRKLCPICGYPLQYRYKNAFGLKLHICTNEPELCGFMTNDYNAGHLSIIKCNKCRDGFLIAKKSDGRYFLGCTNYRYDKKGCNNSISERVIIEKSIIDKVETNTDERRIERKDISLDSLSQHLDIVYKDKSLNKIIVILLNALNHISETHYYGIHMLCDVVKGSQNEKLLKAHFNKIEEYGMLKDYSKDDLIIIVKWMISKNYIRQTKTHYPVLHSTLEGQNYEKTVTKRILNDLLNQLNNQSK